MKIRSLFIAPLLGLCCASAAPVVSYVVPAKINDAVATVEPSNVRVDGWIGRRIDANTFNRLLEVETEPLLAGFKKKPGSHRWIGEHVGKWMHAATLAWDYSQDQRLRQKLDAVAAELIAAQEADGYLGTYIPEKRFAVHSDADWDVWSHKYCMIGLQTYYKYTGNKAALEASKRAADLLLKVFPAQKSILAAGTHEGMASTSVLEPMVDLYRLTGDQRYLDFAHYIVKSYDEPKGPAIVRTLLTEKSTRKTSNGKAYEMLSNLMGLVDLARVTGQKEYITAVSNAWEDIVAKRLFLTGAASVYELFVGDYELPNGEEDHIGETCVTTTWIQLNRSMLQLTGEAKFGTEIERSAYNHLAAAQRPDGRDWCYYTPLEDKKPYDKHITCCHSSGPRAMALLPTVAYLTDKQTVYVNTLESSHAKLNVNGQDVEVALESKFPAAGEATLKIKTSKPAKFAVRVRVPEWGAPLKVGDKQAKSGWLEISAREWKDGDTLPVSFTLAPRVIEGEHTNFARVAFGFGPFILAGDKNVNPKNMHNLPAWRVVLDRPLERVNPEELRFKAIVRRQWEGDLRDAILIPFADAGAEGQEFRVWLRKL